MNRQESEKSETPEEYSWSIEEWARVTHDWNNFNKEFARIGRARDFEDRLAAAQRVRNNAERFADPGYLNFTADLWSLPDEVLDRVIASFDINTR